MDSAVPANNTPTPNQETPQRDTNNLIKQARDDFNKELEEIYLKFLEKLDEIVKK